MSSINAAMEKENRYPFVETIRVDNGVFRHLALHRHRMERTCREVYGMAAPPVELGEESVPPAMREGRVKCRILYGRRLGEVRFERYRRREVRSLRLVEGGDIDYHLKMADRSRLEALRRECGDADEVLIVKNGLVTDTGYTNIVCLADGRWLTPRIPLLDGVMRQSLIAGGEVQEADITPAMLRAGNEAGITAVALINAMLPLEEAELIPVERIN